MTQTPQVTNDIAATVITPNLSQTMPPMPSMPINPTDSFPQTPYSMQMPNMSSMPPQMNPMMMAQYLMMMMNSSSYNSQAQPTDFNSALIDALRIHNVQWPNSQLPPPPTQESPLQSNMYDHQTISRSSTEQNYPYPNPHLFTGSDSQSTSMEAPARKRCRASSASSDSVPMQDQTKTVSPAPKRSKASPLATQSSSERKLFQSKSGKELSFFVQVEMHNRSGVVAAIKVK
jgi:hypothetical protein